MRYRTRLLLAFTAAALLPLAILAVGARREMERRLTTAHERRVASLVSVIEEDLARQGELVRARLEAVAGAAAADNRFRVAVRGTTERAYLLDYAGRAMRQAGLDVLQIQDEEGRILSSGHFRNEYDRLDPDLPRRLAELTGQSALVHARAAEGPFLALARVDSIRLGGERYWWVGGVRVDPQVLARLARDIELAISLWVPGGVLTPEGDARPAEPDARSIVESLTIPYIETRASEDARVVPARLFVAGSLEPLDRLLRDVDAWLAIALAAALFAGLALTVWVSWRVSRPLAALAQKTARLDLDRLDTDFTSDRRDEIGELARGLGAMASRLRKSTARLREAERLAAIGDLARQVNHDVRNGLAPLRNVIRHLAQVARETPGDLARMFRNRQPTIESSLDYLGSLAENYARLTPALQPKLCDVNAVVEEVVHESPAPSRIRRNLTHDIPPAWADRVVLRRILDNLLRNALESLEGEEGTVTVSTSRIPDKSGRAAVRIGVADTGRGMTAEQLERAFDDFYTTRPGGTGLGLSIVRRLVRDSGARLDAQSQPGAGTRFCVDFPAEPGGVALGIRGPAAAPGPLTPPTPIPPTHAGATEGG